MAIELVGASKKKRVTQPGYFRLCDLPSYTDVTTIGSGWSYFDQIFLLYSEQFTVVTGRAGSGKSTFLFNLIINYARIHKMHTLLFCPENQRYVRRNLHKIWGYDDDSGWDNFCRRQCFIQSSSPEHYGDSPMTLPWVLDMAANVVKSDRIDLVVIDPWNELERSKPRDQLLTDYISDCLRYLKGFCRAMETSVMLVAHPTKAGLANGSIPTLVDVEGSLAWHNKCDNGLVVHREPEFTRVISEKVRESPAAGNLGTCNFVVDKETGRFHDMSVELR